MSEQSAFNSNNLKTITIERRRDLFEELNLPTWLADFLRKNSLQLKIAAIIAALALVGWSGYDYYATSRAEQSSALLATALEERSADSRKKLLEELINKYSGTAAASWANLELAHDDYDAGRYAAANQRYSEILSGLGKESPLSPLVHLALAQSLEQNKEPEQAIDHYQKLSTINGFADLGYLALGRIHEGKGDVAKAREAYEKVGTDNGAWAKDRLARLAPAPAGK